MSSIGDLFRKRFIAPNAFGDESADEGEDQPSRARRRIEKGEFDRGAIGARMKDRINAKKVPREPGEETVRPAGTKMGTRG